MLGQAPTTYNFTDKSFTLLQSYYWADYQAALVSLLQQGWDYVVLTDDSFVVSQLPEYHAEGVREIVEQARVTGAQPLLMMQWSSASANNYKVNLFGEVAYRVGDGTEIPVVPAGYVWSDLSSSLHDTSSSHPTPNGSYAAAAAIYSTILQRSASTSSYIPSGMNQGNRNSIATAALSRVQSGPASAPYTPGTYFSGGATRFVSPALSKRSLRFAGNGTSTEGGIADGLTSVIPNYGGVAATRITDGSACDFAEGRLWQYYVAPSATYPISFGFDLEDNSGGLSMLYELDYGNSGYTCLDQASHFLGTAGTYAPIRLLWTKVRFAAPEIPVQEGGVTGWHLHANMNYAIASFMYTVVSRRCAVGDAPSERTSSAWQAWLCRKIGYETAWQMAALTDRVPGFEILPVTVSATSVTPGAPTTMTVRFLYPPKANVTVNVSVDNANAATLNPQTLTFTPSNYNVRQTVKIAALPGSLLTDSFNVNYAMSSTDRIYNGLTDQWAYTVSRSSTQNVALAQASPVSVTTNEDTASTPFSLGVAGATSSNTTLTGPVNGSLSWTGGNLIYTPSANFNGTDSAAFSVLSGGTLTTGSISFTVASVYESPTLALISPSNGASLVAPANLTLSTSGYQEGGSIEFYVDGASVGSVSWPTNSLTWSVSTVGAHTVYAVATDASNAVATTSTASFTVTAPSAAVWTSTTGGFWSGAANWVAGQVGDAGVEADFSQVNVTGTQGVTLDSSRTLSRLDFGDSNIVPPTYLIGTDQYGTPVINLSGPQPVGWILSGSGSSGITLSGTAPTVYVANLGVTPSIWVLPRANDYRVRLSAPIGGSGGLIKDGPGTLVLAGSNSFTGNFTMKNGTVLYSSLSAFGGSTVTLYDGATLQAEDNAGIAGTVSNNIVLTGSTASTYWLAPGVGNTLTFSGAITGTAMNGSAGLWMGGNLGTITTTGNINLGARTLSIIADYPVTGTATSHFILGGTLTVGTLNYDVNRSSGMTLTVGGSAVVNCSGPMVDISDWGYLHVQGQAQVNCTSLTSSWSTGAMYFDGGAVTTGTVTCAGLYFNGGTIRAAAANANYFAGAGGCYVTGGLVFDTNGYNITGTNNLSHSGSGTDGGVTKLGIGTLTLGGSSSFNGPISVQAGTLKSGTATALPNALPLTLVTGATLDLNGSYLTVTSLTGNGSVINGTLTVSGSMSGTNQTSSNLQSLTLGAGSTLSVTLKSGSPAWIISGAAQLNGALTVRLSGSTAFTAGTQIQIISAGLRTGTFSSVNLPAGWQLGYTSTGVILTALVNMPALQLTSPAGPTAIVWPANLPLSAQTFVSGTDAIDHVEFYANSSLVATVAVGSAGLYQSTWTSPAPGSYSVYASAYDTGGTRVDSDPVSVTVNALVSGTATWTSAAGGLWSGTGNWQNGLVADANNYAKFDTVDYSGTTTVTLDSPRSVSGIAFGDAVVSGSNTTLVIGNGGNAANTLTLNGGHPTVTVGDMGTGGATLLGMTMAGSCGLDKEGAGTLILAGSNQFTGGTYVGAGKLSAAASGALAAGTVTVASSGTLAFTGTGTAICTNTNALLLASGGNQTFNLRNDFTASGSVSGTAIVTGPVSAQNVTSGTMTLTANRYSSTQFNGGVALGSLALMLSANGGNSYDTNVGFFGGASTVGSLSMGSPQGMVFTAGSNASLSVSGTISNQNWWQRFIVQDSATVSAAMLSFTASGGEIWISGGGTLAAGQVKMYTNPDFLALRFKSGTFVATSSTNDFMTGNERGPGAGGAFIESSGGFIDTGTNVVTLTRALRQGSTSGGGLTKLGSGTLTFQGGTYTGPTTVANGTLVLDESVGAISTSASTTLTSSTLILAGGNFAFAGKVPVSGTSVTGNIVNITNCDRIDLTGGATTAGMTPGQPISGGALPAGMCVANILSSTSFYLSSTASIGSASAVALTLGALSGGSQSFSMVAMNANGTIAVTARGAGSTVYVGGLSGTGTLTKAGTGLLAITGSSGTHSGGVVVSTGTLALSGSGALASTRILTVSAGAVLDATGRADGTLTLGSAQSLSGPGQIAGSVVSSGTVLAGGAYGTPLITGSYVQTASGNLNVQLASPGSPAIFAPGCPVVLAGSLTVTKSFPCYGGEAFTILSGASVSGSFSSVNLPPLPSGASWNVVYNATNVVLQMNGSFASWIQQFTGLGPWTGPLDTPAGDGVCNLLKYATGLAPTASSTAMVQTGLDETGHLTIQFNRNTNAPFLAVYVEGASSLVGTNNWTVLLQYQNGAWTGSAAYSETPLGNNTSCVIVQDPIAGSKRFLRVRVTAP